ncbi:reverse transcriptase domain-containing protein [Tanacetum coccineum]
MFTCLYGTFAYKGMPFGLCNAPETFQRCMTAIFHELIDDSMEVFMDDFSIFGKLTNAEIRDLFPEERLIAVSDKNNEPCAYTESYEGVSLMMRRHKSFDNVTAAHQEGIMGIDFMGPFPSSNGNKYILVAIDYMSKLVEAQAFPANNARNVVNFLKRQFARFGILKAFISDRAKVKVVRTILSKQRHENGAIKVYDEDGNEFIVNQQRVKPYQKDILDTNRDDDITLEDKGEVTKAHFLEDKQILSVGVFDEGFSTWMAFGGNTRDLGSFEKKWTRLRTYTKSLEESYSQSVETAS